MDQQRGEAEERTWRWDTTIYGIDVPVPEFAQDDHKVFRHVR